MGQVQIPLNQWNQWPAQIEGRQDDSGTVAAERTQVAVEEADCMEDSIDWQKAPFACALDMVECKIIHNDSMQLKTVTLLHSKAVHPSNSGRLDFCFLWLGMAVRGG